LPQHPMDVFVRGSYAYMAAGESGLHILDISNPTNPTIAGSFDTPDFCRDIFVSGQYAYVADIESGLQVINISNPPNPKIVGSCYTQDRAFGVFIFDQYAYIADGFSGLQIISIPPTPVISINPTFNNFGNIPTRTSSLPQIFNISNMGDANLEMGTLSVTGPNALEFNIQNENCSNQTLPPSGSCKVEVVFSPTSAGAKGAILSVPSNDPITPASNVALSGSTIIKGDINGDGNVDQTDVDLALRVLAGENPAGIRVNYVASGADVNGDNRIGMEELVYIQEKMEGVRP